MRVAILSALAVLTTACVSQRWPNYDASLYAISTEPGAPAYEAHAKLLEAWSGDEGGLPPGLAAEEGFYVGLLGRFDQAQVLFDLEVKRYPESAAFVAALRELVIPHEASAAVKATP